MLELKTTTGEIKHSDVFWQLESWGSGVQHIIDACKEQGLEEPIWTDDAGYVTVTFMRPTKEQLERGNGNDTPEVPPKHHS